MPHKFGVESECSTACPSPGETPPTTPDILFCKALARSTSPPCAPVRSERPPLLKALQSRDADTVRQVLAQDSEAAKSPFWDHDVEPALCAAARLLCCNTIVSALLAHGADVNLEDMHGRTALHILQEAELTDAQLALVPAFNRSAMEQLLLDAGARPVNSNLPCGNVVLQLDTQLLPPLDMQLLPPLDMDLLPPLDSFDTVWNTGALDMQHPFPNTISFDCFDSSESFDAPWLMRQVSFDAAEPQF